METTSIHTSRRRAPSRPAPEATDVVLAPRTRDERDLLEMAEGRDMWPETADAWFDSVVTGYVDERGMTADRAGVLLGVPVQSVEAACERSRDLRAWALRHATRRAVRPATV